MKKRFTLFLLPFALLLFFMTACGSQATTGQLTDPKNVTPPTSAKLHSGGGNGCFTNQSVTLDPAGFNFHAVFDSCADVIHMTWDTGNTTGYDSYNFRWSRPELFETQVRLGRYHTDPEDFTNAMFNTTYTLKMQGCDSSWPEGDSCTPYTTIQVSTSAPVVAPDTCIQGYVWRGAVSTDHVCVTPAVRSQTAYDNSQAAYRVNPNGAYGPDTCIQGYVWRGAVNSDHVCVTPATRSQVIYDNSHASERYVR